MVAFSGGPDSTGLAVVLSELGYSVSLAYVNHNLRNEASAKEEEWVRHFASEWAFPLYVLSLNPEELEGGRGIQATARHIRYKWMETLLQENQISWAATAHTREDFVETLFYRFIRGRGPQILQGIPVQRGSWIRPFLNVSRAEIIGFLRERGINYLLDSSNYTPKYLRNQLRWWALPTFYHINPSLSETCIEKWQLYALQWRRFWRIAQRWAALHVRYTPYGEQVMLLPPLDIFHILATYRWKIPTKEANQLYKLWKQKHSGAFLKRGAFRYVVTPRGLQIGRQELWDPEWDILNLSSEPGSYQWGLWYIETGNGKPPSNGEVLMWSRPKIKFPLKVRKWRKGDRMQPAGLAGHTKRLSDIWVEIRKYGFERQHAFVVEDREGKIVGAIGYRVAEGTAPPDAEEEIFYLRAAYGAVSAPPK
ncbi:MAG: tRNA lysidine(34) synthetase TilS [Bacteroidia bacterium]|nr:tRNA lysidine(34) synthetase TilS [Bacteroidia bacterium]